MKDPFPRLVFKNEFFSRIENTTIGMRLSLAIDIADESITCKLSANTFASKLLIEGPIFKSKDGGASSSFIFRIIYSALVSLI